MSSPIPQFNSFWSLQSLIEDYSTIGSATHQNIEIKDNQDGSKKLVATQQQQQPTSNLSGAWREGKLSNKILVSQYFNEMSTATITRLKDLTNDIQTISKREKLKDIANRLDELRNAINSASKHMKVNDSNTPSLEHLQNQIETLQNEIASKLKNHEERIRKAFFSKDLFDSKFRTPVGERTLDYNHFVNGLLSPEQLILPNIIPVFTDESKVYEKKDIHPDSRDHYLALKKCLKIPQIESTTIEATNHIMKGMKDKWLPWTMPVLKEEAEIIYEREKELYKQGVYKDLVYPLPNVDLEYDKNEKKIVKKDPVEDQDYVNVLQPAEKQLCYRNNINLKEIQLKAMDLVKKVASIYEERFLINYLDVNQEKFAQLKKDDPNYSLEKAKFLDEIKLNLRDSLPAIKLTALFLAVQILCEHDTYLGEFVPFTSFLMPNSDRKARLLQIEQWEAEFLDAIDNSLNISVQEAKEAGIDIEKMNLSKFYDPSLKEEDFPDVDRSFMAY